MYFYLKFFIRDYSKYLGPPLINTFKNICGYCDEDAQKGVEIYKEFYQKEGIKHNYLYDGVEQVLKTLKENNVPMAVCSSKFCFFKGVVQIIEVGAIDDLILIRTDKTITRRI